MTLTKLICIDIDGTLLDSHHNILPSTVEAINQSRKNGLKVVLASARPPEGIKFLHQALGLDSPVISFNGALVLRPNDSGDWDIWSSTEIDAQMAIKVFEVANGFQANVNLYRGADWFALKKDGQLDWEESVTQMKADIKSLPPILSAWAEKGIGPNKILLMASPIQIEKMEQMFKGTLKLPLNIYQSRPEYLEITHPEISKVSAIQALAQTLGIKQDEIMAIGDNFNDLPMIEYAGIGVAMGNAPQAVRQAANFVTRSNDGHGIAHAFKYFGLS